MGDGSQIEWTDATWNPLTGCTRVSPGCDHCYMFRGFDRLARMGVPGYTGMSPESPNFHQDRLDAPSRWKRPRLVFVNSMSDTFHTNVPDTLIDRIFLQMLAAPQHTYQVLTKRANRVRRWWDGFQLRQPGIEWPPHIWLGTSVESAPYLARVQRILGIAPVTFISAEPLLGPLTHRQAMGAGWDTPVYIEELLITGGVEWVIAGGESGPGYRRVDPDWIRGIRDACVTTSVPFFFKQWGGATPKAGGRVIDGETWDEMPAAVHGRANEGGQLAFV